VGRSTVHQFTAQLQAELLGRMVLAVVLGSVLGWERQMGRHPAGLRTHMLVSLGAAAFTIAGTYGVAGFGTVQDAGRVSAQIITGIGFLGAGTIWRSTSESGGIIRGLTTAASIWVAASIGMLTGYGLYILATGTAIIGLVVLRLVRGLERAPGVVVRMARRPFRSARPEDVPAVATAAVVPVASTFAPAPAPAAGRTATNGTATKGTAASAAVPPEVDETEQEGAASPRAGKRKRPRKKDRKRKKRDLPTDHVDEISDEPEEFVR
jgi:putative Mg2+ transporter-C (MgtC) family protein